MFLKLFFFTFLSVAIGNEEKCKTIKNSMFYGDSCFVMSAGKKNFNDAKSSCNDFPMTGHLAWVLTEKTLNMVKELAAVRGLPWVAIGLYQVCKSEEPAGGWAWLLPNGQQWMIPDNRLLLWHAGTEPDNGNKVEHAGFYDAGRLRDGNEVAPVYYLCEYEMQTKTYNLGAKDKMGHMVTYLGDSIVADSAECGNKCSEMLLCRGYSYIQSKRHCILHSTTSDGITALPPLESQGYEMFDSNY